MAANSRSIITNIDDIENAVVHVINTARQQAVIVSPYIQVQLSKSRKWSDLETAIDQAIARGVSITFVCRDRDKYHDKDNMRVLAEFRARGCSVFMLDNLHAKIYFNESMAVISSMNLTMASTIRNHEIAVIISNPPELQQVREYVIDLVGIAKKKSIGGGRVISMEKAPAGLKDVTLTITKVTKDYYHARINGKYFVKISRDAGSMILGKIYACKADVQWRRVNGKNRAYIGSVIDIKPS